MPSYETGKEAEGELASLRARAEKAEAELAELTTWARELARYVAHEWCNEPCSERFVENCRLAAFRARYPEET